MLVADLHDLTRARHIYYNRRQDAEEPSVIIEPWVTVELFDDQGSSVCLFIRSHAQAATLAAAGDLAGRLLATGEAEPADVPGQGHGRPSPADHPNDAPAPTVTQGLSSNTGGTG
jgi:hypothetical protein